MRTNNDRITVPQAVALIITTTLGVGILTLPHDVAKAANSDGWILVLLGGILVFVVSLISGAFIRRFPEETFVETSQRVLGKTVGRALAAIFLIYLTVETGYVTRSFAAVMKAFMLGETPTEFLMITLLLSSVYLIRHGIEPIARVGEILFPILVVPVIIMYLILIPRSDFAEILPFLATPPVKLALGVTTTMMSFLGFEILLMIGPYIRSPERINWILFASLGTVTAISVFVTVVVFAAIGVDDAKLMIWPSMTVIRNIATPGLLLERMDALALALRIIAAFTTINGAYFTASLTLAHLTKSKEFKGFVTLLFPWIYMVGLYPENVYTLTKLPQYLGPIGFGIAILFPILIISVDALSKRRSAR